MIKVDANLFRLAYAAVSTEETRYYLNGVHIEPHPVKGAILVSTDGRRMIVIHDPDGECDESKIIKLPRFALAECKTAKMFGLRRRLDVDTSATITEVTPGKKSTDPKTERAVLSAFGVVVDGTFPDWRRVIPTAPVGALSPEPVAFDSKFLKAFGDLGTDIAQTVDGASVGMQISQPAAGGPTIIRWNGATNMFAVLMPFRVDVRGYLPAFMDVPEATSIAAE